MLLSAEFWATQVFNPRRLSIPFGTFRSVRRLQATRCGEDPLIKAGPQLRTA